MAREYLISITGNVASVPTTVWLTKDGTNTGPRCKTEIPGIDQLFATNSGNTTVAAGGNTWTEKPLAAGGGRPVEIHFLGTISAAGLFADLKALFDDADTNNGVFTVTIAGDPGSISIVTAPFWNPVPFGFGRFSGGRIRDVFARMISQPS